MHAVQEGAASKSYGLQVAALAGVPLHVIQAAKHKLHQLESRDQQVNLQGSTAANNAAPMQQSLTLSTAPMIGEKALNKLALINPDELSPKQALDLLYELKKLAKS
jgi:DNA mismatch repair protein MutS